MAKEGRQGMLRSPAVANPPILSTRRGRERFLLITFYEEGKPFEVKCDFMFDEFVLKATKKTPPDPVLQMVFHCSSPSQIWHNKFNAIIQFQHEMIQWHSLALHMIILSLRDLHKQFNEIQFHPAQFSISVIRLTFLQLLSSTQVLFLFLREVLVAGMENSPRVEYCRLNLHKCRRRIGKLNFSCTATK